jgi:hypothetical protein
MSDSVATTEAAPAANTGAEAPAGSLLNNAGSGSPDWRATLPAELADHAKRFNDPAAAVKAHYEAEKLIGRKGVILPKEGDPPEVVSAYRAAMGIPEAPDKYELKVEAPENVWNADVGKRFAELAHKHGLTVAQAQGLAADYAAIGAEGIGAQEAARAQALEAGMATLKGEWGAGFDKKAEYANRALREFGGEEAVARIKELGLANEPAIAKMLAAVGERMSEDSPAGIGSKQAPRVSPQDEIKALMAADSPYWKPMHPEHRATVARVTELHGVAAA